MTILDTIAEHTRSRVARLRAARPLEEVVAKARALPRGDAFAFERALKGPEVSFICEVKKASPSKGVIAEDFPYRKIAEEYERAGAAAISVLTEPEYFLGSDRYLEEIKSAVNIPVLRKDFTVDEYQIYEAKCLGADAVLLICALLPEETLRRYIEIADSLGLSALVEAHDADEIAAALAAGARVVGVNNRNLKDFTVDVQNSLKLRALVPENVAFVSESGVKTAADIAALRDNRVQAALIGETLMRSVDKTAALAALCGGSRTAKLKICGLTRSEDIAAVNRARPDYVGFVFAASRRQVTPKTAATLKAQLCPEIRTVGVFVNAASSEIAAIAAAGTIDLVQLHGDETEAQVREIRTLTGKPVVKAVRVRSAADIAAWQDSAADYLLLDAWSPDGYGGTGEAFDWNAIRDVKKPFFLAGGLNAKNATLALRRVRPYAVDLSSGVETDGYKDEAKIGEIADLVRRVTI